MAAAGRRSRGARRTRRAEGRAGAAEARAQAARRRRKRRATAEELAEEGGLDGVGEEVRAGQRERLASARRIAGAIRQQLSRVAPDAHAIGTLLAELREARGHVQLGYATWSAMLKGERLVAAGTARKYMAVAEGLRAEQVEALGVERAYAVLRYADEAGEGATAEALVDADVEIEGTAISGCSVRAIRRATKAAVATGSRRTVERVRRQVERALEAGGAEGYAVRARVVRGEWVVEVSLRAEDARRVRLEGEGRGGES